MHHLSLEEAIATRRAQVAVVGLGYVGLPLAGTFVRAGFAVQGLDIDGEKVSLLRQGRSYLPHLDTSWLVEAVEAGSFQPISDPMHLRAADAVLLCVPTPLTPDGRPELGYVRAAAEQLLATLRPGQLVVLESTTFPGTTRDVLLPVLASGGHRPGRDFFLAYSPEREDPGNRKFGMQDIPKIVGGIDEASLHLAQLLYRQAFSSVTAVSSCEVAEAAKLLENTYRAVNIALVNEFKCLFDRLGLDVWEVIEAAATKPFGFQAFAPGPGVGGHCIPVDPCYWTWLARRRGAAARLVEEALAVNRGMPAYVLQKIRDALAQRGKTLSGSRVGLLGVAYKRDIADCRESPAAPLWKLLADADASVSYSDPCVPEYGCNAKGRAFRTASCPLTAEYIASVDCLVIVTDHSAVDYRHVLRHASLIVDTRGVLRSISAGCEKVVNA